MSFTTALKPGLPIPEQCGAPSSTPGLAGGSTQHVFLLQIILKERVPPSHPQDTKRTVEEREDAGPYPEVAAEDSAPGRKAWEKQWVSGFQAAGPCHTGLKLS